MRRWKQNVTHPEILISAGEASSDMYAARLATALTKRTGAHLFGMGGPRMREAGVDLVVDCSEIAVVGIFEVLKRLPNVWRAWRRMEQEAARRSPKLGILLDSPGFNLGMGRRLRKQGIPLVYFISPQVWAWRPGRVKIIKRLVKRMLVIFPFEEEFYSRAGVPVDFVGHPLADTVHATMTRAEFAARHSLDPARPILALLPGSRPSELAYHMPVILEACVRLARDLDPQLVLAAAPGVSQQKLAGWTRPGLKIHTVEGATYDALAAADVAIVSSGTATVEAALLETPMVVIYRVSRLSALVGRRMIRTPFFAMANLIAGRQIVPELIQEGFTAPALESEVRRLLVSDAARQQMKQDLGGVRAKLGSGGAIERAAGIIGGLLENMG
ncbi:MAG TPA: lipid-A-disaccharide synthase [Candidatus Acidoferrales bacterium]|nr:lipid-A-disaccharide synthase [Candidatus Acidoferrales bacterium]